MSCSCWRGAVGGGSVRPIFDYMIDGVKLFSIWWINGTRRCDDIRIATAEEPIMEIIKCNQHQQLTTDDGRVVFSILTTINPFFKNEDGIRTGNVGMCWKQ